ncbi:hypothetical protein QTO34_005423 [Cnephaeus nilssonii]|uniref:Uncharacterized protein n=1 Tax=Cnephaeus nilssonii TaxID=3371016 RepID=A0AA40HNJ2_CNENI|nr:hypothetical protein QTO34_005423 [Eptesicus nilssonii]
MRGNTAQRMAPKDALLRLETHITKFHLRRMWGLPTKVLEPRENIKLKYTSSHSLLDSKSSSSTNLI